MKKHLFSIVALTLALCLCLSLGAAAADTPSAWAVEDVQASIDAGIVPAALRSDYAAPITRSRFCALATAVYETVTGSEITQRRSFTDTREVPVEKMAAVGVVDGVGDGRFDPDGTLTREQAATIIDRLSTALGYPLADSTTTFADKHSISYWATAAVGRVQAAGIMNGVGDNTFSPQGSYTVEQSIVTMLRTMQSMTGEKQVTVVASGSCGKQTKWALDSNGVLTISGSGAMESYTSKKAPWNYLSSKIKTVVVEDGVTNLSRNCFAGLTGLTSVKLSDTVTSIKSQAFNGCSALTSIYLPQSVTNLEDNAFSGASGLTDITVDSANPTYRSVNGVVFSKDMTTLYVYPAGSPRTSYTIPEGVQVVYNGALHACNNLTSLTIPASLEQMQCVLTSQCPNLRDVYIDNYWHLDSILGYETTQDAWNAVTVHASDVALTYTANSAADLHRIAGTLNTAFPTVVDIQMPASLESLFQDYIKNRVNRYNYRYSLRNRTDNQTGMTVYQLTVQYQNGLDLLPYHKGNLDRSALNSDSVQLLNRAEEVLNQITTPEMGDYETVKAIHDWLVNNTTYAYSGRYEGPFGPIMDGTSVCEGYSCAFQVLCTLSDIDCLYMAGDTTQGLHAWNKVCVDGVWYNVDVTWDDPTGGVDTLRYDYFLISDATLSRDHTWNRDWVPACDRDYPSDHQNQQSSSNTGSSSTVTDTPDEPEESEEYTGGYWDTWVDQYGFTWVELDDTLWALFIGGEKYGEFWQDIQGEMWGCTMDDFVRNYGFRHYEEHSPSEQTAEDVAPRERGW